MIISRTPFRMSFVGGGSDLPAFYHMHSGAVISTAIDKYVYVNINKKFDSGIRVAYSKTEEVSSVMEIEHRIVRASMELLGMEGGIEIASIADIPSSGTGLGSSSSFTVGLLHALNAYLGRFKSNDSLGKDSCDVEIGICKAPIGKQDQYAAAFGGFNFIEFHPNEVVTVSPIISKKETLRKIEESILLFYTGVSRSASNLLKQQSEDIFSSELKQKTLLKMVSLAHSLKEELQSNNIDAFGEILHENWELKKTITDGVSTPEIDNWYLMARKAGATGGKILGAGAGGFLLLAAPPEKHRHIITVLSGLKHVPVKFEPAGSKIIFYN
jgi:D-glycero-alpha-D-manno-heptose-7-phosphate kinase